MGRVTRSLAALSVVGMLLAGTPALAAGNLAANGEALELKIDTTNLKFSQNEFDLETGKYYRMDITADDGADNLRLAMPDFWRNVWVNQMVVDDIAVQAQEPYGLEFDGAGTINISFVPIRPGEYEFYSPGYENKGLKGKFVVK